MTLDNPYLDAVNAPITADELNALGLLSDDRWGGSLARRMRRSGRTMHNGLVDQYAWAIPNENAVRHIAKFSPLVEVCAGRGYWAWMLAQLGADVLAYDIAPPGPTSAGANFWHQGATRTFVDVKRGDAELVTLAYGAERTLFLCWPPYDDPTASRAIQAYDRVGGRNVVYIGEGEGGCTGDKRFHELLDERWESIEGCRIPQWDGIHDYVHCYTRPLR